ncbi:CHAD domain-containing protein [Gryllotalpicola ginsengisoli]|uniref:CHAD domain-containing protein n=1 Tax=Gryllotalpicola ginsengisoli TaxID=444608 RepID=UPI0003B6E69A|nr:CHAD domain-containing protein [Gryllotalpicola ginsengisoli]
MATRSDVATWIDGVIETLLALEEPVRRDEPDAVHKARTATRRLRVVLPLVPGEASARAQKQLRRYGHRLGAARDLEVRAALAERMLRELGRTRGKADARRRLVDEVRREYAAAHGRVVGFLDGPGYGKLRRALEEVREPAASVDELAVLHAARKAARALRYLAEAYGDLEKAAAGEAVQDALGEHRDSELFARDLDGADDPVSAELCRRARRRANELVSKQ